MDINMALGSSTDPSHSTTMDINMAPVQAQVTHIKWPLVAAWHTNINMVPKSSIGYRLSSMDIGVSDINRAPDCSRSRNTNMAFCSSPDDRQQHRFRQ